MPTRNINLTARQSAYVDRIVRSGRYQNASEAIRAALRALEHQEQERAYRLQLLRDQIGAGVDALKQGDFIDVDVQDLDAFLGSPSIRGRRSRRPQKRNG